MTLILNCFNRSREDEKKCKDRVRKILFGDQNNSKRFPNRVMQEEVLYLTIPEYIKENPTKWLGLIGKPYLEAFNTVGGLFYLINTLAEGYPSVYSKVVNDFLAYGSIPTALMSATAATLSQSTYAFAGLPIAYVKAVNRTVMVAAANSQITFEAVTDIIRHVKQLPPNVPVDISNFAAWSIAMMNFLGALIRGIQAYHIETHFGPPVVIPYHRRSLFSLEETAPGCANQALDFMNRLAKHPLATRFFTLVDVVGATNLFIGELEKLFLPQAGSIGVFARYGVALFLGAAASMLAGGTIDDQGIVTRDEADGARRVIRKPAAKYVDLTVAIVRSIGVGIMIGSRLAGGVFATAIVYEQLAFWFAAIILYNFLSQLAVHHIFNTFSDMVPEFEPDQRPLIGTDPQHDHPASCFCCLYLPLFRKTTTQPGAHETTSLLDPTASISADARSFSGARSADSPGSEKSRGIYN